MSSGISLVDGREAAGAQVTQGDRVFIYQAKTGPAVVEKDTRGKTQLVRRKRGRGGIVALCEVSSPLLARGDVPVQVYMSGRRLWWRWRAETRPLLDSSFVPAQRVAPVLGYKPTYNFHGFGTRVNGKPSGLGPLTKDQYLSLLNLYKENTPQPKQTRQAITKLRKLPIRGRGGSRFESKAHKLLKDLVAASPDKVLREVGLRTVTVERALDTGDRPDIVLEDALGRPVGVEVEVDVRAGDLVGALQAAKYRALLAFLSDRPHFEARGFLVAYSISRDVRERCERYGINAIEVPRRGRGKR